MLSTAQSTARFLRPFATQRILQGATSRTLVVATRPVRADLPYHIVVGMPALSPTMEAGILAEWYVGDGDSFGAGDSVAKIETDKASIDFEAQDDAWVAKLLVAAGDGADIAVGTPIMITVEEADDVAAFKDYVHVTEPVAAAPAPAAPEPAAAAAAAPEPTPVVVAAPLAPVAPVAAAVAPTPVAVAASPSAPPAAAAVSVASGISTAWGLHAQTSSPLVQTLRKKQTAYLQKYGSSGQLPL